ncbi:MAG: HEAT repeat domain-containing protein [Isosphaeraceae bacterium]
MNLLDDPRPAVQHRAIETLAGKDEGAIALLAQMVAPDRSVNARRNAVWTATRIDHPAARVVIHAVSLRRDQETVPALVLLLHNPSLQNRRAAAEALGRIGDRAAVPELLKALGELSAPDRTLEHSLTYAFIEIGDPRGAAEGLRNAGSRTRRAALVALDQMNGGGLDPVQAAALLTASDPHRFHPRTDPDLAAHNSPSRPSLWK